MYVHVYPERAADDAAAQLEFAPAPPSGSPASRCVPSTGSSSFLSGKSSGSRRRTTTCASGLSAYLHKETLTGLMQRLNPASFLRIHRSHAVNIALVRELRPQLHGEYVVALADGTELTSGRSYRNRIQRAFGLSRTTEP